MSPAYRAAIAALRQRGAVVFRCDTEKRALTPKAAELRPVLAPSDWSYWTSDELKRCTDDQPPGPLVGIVPGSIGLLVVDIDTDTRGRDLATLDPATAAAEVEAVVRALGAPLLSVRTAKRNHRHLYFLMAEPDRHVEYTGAGADKHARGEVRASKGYVVMHGQTAAMLVAALNRAPATDTPLTVDAVRAFTRAEDRERATENGSASRSGDGHPRRGEGGARAYASVSDALDALRTAPLGTRHHTRSAAGVYLGRRLARDEVTLAAIIEAARAGSDAPDRAQREIEEQVAFGIGAQLRGRLQPEHWHDVFRRGGGRLDCETFTAKAREGRERSHQPTTATGTEADPLAAAFGARDYEAIARLLPPRDAICEAIEDALLHREASEAEDSGTATRVRAKRDYLKCLRRLRTHLDRRTLQHAAGGSAETGEPGVNGLCNEWNLDEKPPSREWLIDRWMAAYRITILTGRGGAGKSRLALQLAMAMAAGVRGWLPVASDGGKAPADTPWLVSAEPVPVVFASWEDEKDEIARRLYGIHEKRACRDRPEWDIKDRLHYVHPPDQLWAPDPDGSRHTSTTGQITPAGLWLRNYCTDVGARLLVVDPRAAAYGLSEIDRSLVRAFLSDWDRWAQSSRCTVLLLAHPAKNEAKDAASAGAGSTDWHAAARAVWELEAKPIRERRKQGNRLEPAEAVPVAPKLTLDKTNYAKAGATVWLSGSPEWVIETDAERAAKKWSTPRPGHERPSVGDATRADTWNDDDLPA